VSEVTFGEILYDPAHPLRSPLLGKIVSRTACALGHKIVIMDHERWDESWMACATCGARFATESMLTADDTEGDDA